jgi:hypothetical protein
MPKNRTPFKPRIAITPDVDAELKALKKRWHLQSHNKVLRRLLALRQHTDGAERDGD